MKWLSKQSTVCLAIAAGALSLAACEVATAVPNWDTTWAVPAEALELAVASLLPGEVTVTPDGKALELEIDGVRIEERLGDLCIGCQALNGQTVPKPPFFSLLESGISLPTDVLSASVIGGQVLIELYHDFGFDPIRPGALAYGSIRVALTSAGDTLAAGTIAGEDEAFPSGTLKRLSLPFRNAELSNAVELSVIIDSPAGDAVQIDTSRRFELTVAPSVIRISEVEVRVQNQEVDLAESSIEVVGGEGVVNRINGGALILEIENPFQISGAIALTVTGPDLAIERQIQLVPGSSETRIEFTGPELRSILRDEKATLGATGSVSAVGGTVTIRPEQVLQAKSRFELTIATKEN
jgi:hypothetical protein